MSSRRRRLATLRRAGPPAPAEIDETDDNGMDALPEPDETGPDAARSRSAPAFCRPKPVSPRPYQSSTASPTVSLPPVPARPRSDDLGEMPPADPPRPTRWREALARVRTAPPLAPPPQAAPPTVSPSPPPRVSGPCEPPMSSPASLYDDPPPVRRIAPPVPASTQEFRPLWDDDERVPAPAVEQAPAWTGLGRGVALLLGTLLAVDLFSAGGLPASGPWWLDTRPLPEAASAALLGLSAAALIAFAARPALPGPIRTVTILCVGLLIAVALKNTTVYYGLLKRGDLHAGPPVAFSLHIVGCLGVVLLALRAASGTAGVRGLLLALIGFNAGLVTLPIAQIACTGPIDARRPAAAAVVWGPRPFEAQAEERFEDRVRTAVELYSSNLTRRLLIAGGPDGERLERLQTIARDAGLPDDAFEVLPATDDAATCSRLRTDFPAEDGVKPTLLVVSDYDHLPRLVLAARHADLTLTPVPAPSRPDRTVLLREAVELWRCYFRR